MPRFRSRAQYQIMALVGLVLIGHHVWQILTAPERGTQPTFAEARVNPDAGSSGGIVTWNAEWFPGRKPGATESQRLTHAKAFRRALKTIRPKVLLLQEVSHGPLLTDSLAAVGLELHTISKFPGAQQTAIASSLPARSAWFEGWKTDGKDDPPRGYAFAALEREGGGTLMVYSVHLKSNSDEARAEDRMAVRMSNREKREEAVRQLVAHVQAERPKQPEPVAVVIGGDFNTDPGRTGNDNPFAGERTIPQLLEAGFSWGFQGLERDQTITWPKDGKYPDASFDHLFLLGLDGQARVLSGFDDVSDHRPVVLGL